MSSVSLDNDWRRLVRGAVERADVTIRDLARQKEWKFIIRLLDDYNRAAAVAMGSVMAKGGYPTIDFRGVSVHDKEWKKLSHWTVAFKNGIDTEELMHDDGMRGNILGSTWDFYADSTPIWKHEGGAKESLDANYRKGIAGIIGGAAQEYAETVENGGSSDWPNAKPVPARPLFSALNEAFYQYVSEQLHDSKSALYTEIKNELKAAGKWTRGKLR